MSSGVFISPTFNFLKFYFGKFLPPLYRGVFLFDWVVKYHKGWFLDLFGEVIGVVSVDWVRLEVL